MTRLFCRQSALKVARLFETPAKMKKIRHFETT
jgi:hypothetical protein